MAFFNKINTIAENNRYHRVYTDVWTEAVEDVGFLKEAGFKSVRLIDDETRNTHFIRMEKVFPNTRPREPNYTVRF